LFFLLRLRGDVRALLEPVPQVHPLRRHRDRHPVVGAAGDAHDRAEHLGLADHTGKRLLVVKIAATMSAVCYLGVFATASFWGMLLVLGLMSFFWSASMPLVEATTLTYLGKHSARYGRIRSWAWIGFIASVVGLGYALDYM